MSATSIPDQIRLPLNNFTPNSTLQHAMDPTNISTAPELLRRLTTTASLLTYDDVQRDHVLLSTCQDTQAACHALYANMNLLLSHTNDGGPEETTESDSEEVSFPHSFFLLIALPTSNNPFRNRRRKPLQKKLNALPAIVFGTSRNAQRAPPLYLPISSLCWTHHPKHRA